MTGMQAFRAGIATATRNPALVFTLYGVNLLLALPLAVGFRVMIGSAFGSSMAAEPLGEGFDVSVVRDVFSASGGALRGLIWTAIPTALLGMLVNAILAAGILPLLLRGDAFSFRAFVDGIGTYAGRFVRIWLVMIAVGLGTGVLLTIPFTMVLGSAIDSDSGRTAVLGTILGLFVYSPLIIVAMAADYARIHCVAGDVSSAWKSVGQGFLFVARNAGAACTLQLWLILLFIGAVVLYWGGEWLLGMVAPSAYILLAVLQQTAIGARMWVRVGTFAGAATLFEERKPRPVTFYGWDDSPAQEPA